MIDVKFDNLPNVQKELKGFEDQIPFAIARALTLTAKDVQQDLRPWMERVIDRPTRFTLNATFVTPARKRDSTPAAEVGLKDWAAKGGNARDYLRPLIYGGRRTPKRSEKALRQRGHLRAGEFLVPGRDQRLNKFGNIPKAQVDKAMSHIKGHRDSAQNTTTRKRGGRQYFWLPRTGIFYRQGRRLKALLVVARQPNYQQQLDFHGFAERSAAKHLPDRLAESMRFARDTARR